MGSRPRIAGAICCAAIVVHAAAARAEKVVEPLLPPSVFSRLTVQDGLPQDQVNVIGQDGLGFLWFGTDAGLARYDGYRFRIYQNDLEDPTTISSNSILALATDDQGRLWIGTNGGGLNVYDPRIDKLRRHAISEDAELNALTVLSMRADGKKLWAGTAEGLLLRIDTATDKVTVLDLDEQATAITAIVKAPKERLWLATASGMLLVGADGKLTALPERLGADKLPGSSITDLATDGNSLWIAFEKNGIARYSIESGELVTHTAAPDDTGKLMDDQVLTLLIDDEKTLWVGTKGGLHALPRGQTAFKRYLADKTDANMLPYPWVSDSFQDRSGVLWFATIAGGLGKLDRRRSRFSLRSSSTNMFTVDAEGRLWTGDQPGELRRYDRGAGVVTVWSSLTNGEGQPELDLHPYWTSSMHFSGGRLYVGLDGRGLLSFDPATETYELFEPGEGASALHESRIYAIAPGAKDKLWLGTFGAGLAAFDPAAKTFKHYSTQTKVELPSDFLYAVHPQRSDPNQVWIGMAQGGLGRVDIVNETVATFEKQVRAKNVYSIHEAADGVLWLGTESNGLVRFDPATGKATEITTKQGMPSNRVLGVLADDKARLWMSTDGGGLACYDPSDKKVRVFRTADGVPLTFNQNTYLESPKGEMFFGGSAGFISFFPDDIKFEAAQPKLTLTEILLFDQPVESDKPAWDTPDLDLAYRESLVTLGFTVFDYSLSDRTQFAYRIDGLYDQWIDLPSPRIALSVPDGSYSLQVRARVDHGEWTKSLLSLPIHVSAPFWRTWWAFCLYGVLLLAMAAAYRSYQGQRVAKLHSDHRLAAVNRDLALTAAVQEGFLPALQQFEHQQVVLRGFYRAAEMCSGDWWYYDTAHQRILVLVGDVTGHGPGPAMVTAAVGTAFRVTHGVPLLDRLEVLNDEVLRVGRGKYHMTMTAVELDPQTGQFAIASAGGLPALRYLAGPRPKVVAARGTPLGTTPFQPGMSQGQLELGERLFLLTDGIVEIEQTDGKMFGMRNLSKLFATTCELDLTRAMDQILSAVDQARGGVPQNDDWTFVLLDYAPDQRTASRQRAMMALDAAAQAEDLG